MNGPSKISLAVGVVGLLAAAAMGVVLVTDDDGSGGTALGATEEGFVVEPASSVGPDAFTPSVEVDGEAICDTDQFVAELMSRPDAVREWSRVLGLPEGEVAGYVAGLTPTVLTEDTAVTNHGLRNGAAYARPSMLEAGTAVLMGSLPAAGTPILQPPEDSTPPLTEPTTTTATTTTSSTTLTVPTTATGDEEIPVTRCRCGNPLLPPYAPTGEDPPTTTTTEPTTTTTVLTTPTDDPQTPPAPDPSVPSASSTPTDPSEPTDPSVPTDPSAPDPSDDVVTPDPSG